MKTSVLTAFFRKKTATPTALAFFAFAAMVASSCASRPVEEIVTTDAGRVSALPTAGEPLIKEANLPTRDADLEAAGDRIGEAITYLDSRRRDRHDLAIGALGKAEAALLRLEHNLPNSGSDQSNLQGILRDLRNAKIATQRSAPDASRQLTVLNKRLDSLELETRDDLKSESK
jgi:hypothetical protein